MTLRPTCIRPWGTSRLMFGLAPPSDWLPSYWGKEACNNIQASMRVVGIMPQQASHANDS